MYPCREEIRSIMLSTNKIDGVYYLLSRRMGLKANTLALLYALDDGKVHSQKQICEEWLIPKTTLNTIVRECIAEGYITLISEEHTREKVIQMCIRDSPNSSRFKNTLLNSACSALYEYTHDTLTAVNSYGASTARHANCHPLCPLLKLR